MLASPKARTYEYISSMNNILKTRSVGETKKEDSSAYRVRRVVRLPLHTGSSELYSRRISKARSTIFNLRRKQIKAWYDIRSHYVRGLWLNMNMKKKKTTTHTYVAGLREW